MSIERTVTDIASGTEISMEEAIKLDPEETKKLRAEKKARFARILERGMVADRLAVELPDNLYGEWVPNDKSEIYRMQLLGFKIDTEYATKRALHSEGDGKSVIGDTVFMTCAREDKDILEEIRRENFVAMNGKPGEVKSQQEEKEYATQSRTIGMPVIEESVSRTARKEQLESALAATRKGTIVR